MGVRYSKEIPGARDNYRWPVSFDVDDGYVGISQFQGEHGNERVLLSPAQYRALVEFVGSKPRKRAAKQG